MIVTHTKRNIRHAAYIHSTYIRRKQSHTVKREFPLSRLCACLSLSFDMSRRCWCYNYVTHSCTRAVSTKCTILLVSWSPLLVVVAVVFVVLLYFFFLFFLYFDMKMVCVQFVCGLHINRYTHAFDMFCVAVVVSRACGGLPLLLAKEVRLSLIRIVYKYRHKRRDTHTATHRHTLHAYRIHSKTVMMKSNTDCLRVDEYISSQLQNRPLGFYIEYCSFSVNEWDK